jgi:NADH-quinone oxidoreductase subunit C
VHVAEEHVPAAAWRERCAELAAGGAAMLDFLTGVDDPAAGRIAVVAHVVDVAARRRVLLRTEVDRADPVLDSIVGVYAGAAWHERETHELLGVRFAGHPDLRPLLTTGAMGFPLRRTTPLPVRVATPWPGATDPADRPAQGAGRSSRVAARPRSRLAPPGVPAEWELDARTPEGEP